MASVTAKAVKVDQKAKDYNYDQDAEEEIRRRWDQLKKRKQANQSDKYGQNGDS